MGVGRHNTWVEIYKTPLVSDDMGGKIAGTPVLQDSMWCERRPISESRALELGMTQFANAFFVTLPYTGVTVDESYFLKMDDYKYIIHSVTNRNDANVWLDLITYKDADISSNMRILIDQGSESLTAGSPASISFNFTFPSTSYTMEGRGYKANGQETAVVFTSKTTTGVTALSNETCTLEWTAILRA